MNRSRVDIEECLAAFTEQETLDGNEQPVRKKEKVPVDVKSLLVKVLPSHFWPKVYGGVGYFYI